MSRHVLQEMPIVRHKAAQHRKRDISGVSVAPARKSLATKKLQRPLTLLSTCHLILASSFTHTEPPTNECVGASIHSCLFDLRTLFALTNLVSFLATSPSNGMHTHISICICIFYIYAQWESSDALTLLPLLTNNSKERIKARTSFSELVCAI